MDSDTETDVSSIRYPHLVHHQLKKLKQILIYNRNQNPLMKGGLRFNLNWVLK